MAALKAKDRRDIELRRGKATRPQRRRILIACEGDKVEPGYLHGVRLALGLDARRVVILPSGHDSDPRNVVKAALAQHNREDQSFDLIYCVVDKDTHPGLIEAHAMVSEHKLGKAGVLALVVSNPCFEAWLLMHLEPFSTAPFQNSAEAKARMEKALPGYAKLATGLHKAVAAGQDQAMKHAVRLDEEHK